MKIKNAKNTLNTKRFKDMYKTLQALNNAGKLIDYEQEVDEASLIVQIRNDLLLEDIIDLKRCKADNNINYRKVPNENTYYIYESGEKIAETDRDDECLLDFLNDIEILTLWAINNEVDSDWFIKADQD